MNVASRYPALGRARSLAMEYSLSADSKRLMAGRLSPSLYFTSDGYAAQLRANAETDDAASGFLAIVANEAEELSREVDRLERRGNALCRLLGVALGILAGLGVWQLLAFLE